MTERTRTGFYWKPVTRTPQQKARMMKTLRERGVSRFFARCCVYGPDTDTPLKHYLPHVVEMFWEHDKHGKRVRKLAGWDKCRSDQDRIYPTVRKVGA